MAEKDLPSDPGARRIIGRLLGVGIIVAAAIALRRHATPVGDEAADGRCHGSRQLRRHRSAGQRSYRRAPCARQPAGQEGDLLFLIDPRPYEIALERARATLALTRKEVDGLKNGAATAVAGVSRAEAQLNASAAEVTRREMDPVVADAEIARLKAQFQHAEDHLKRLEPLLPQQFVTADRVEEARTQRAAALAALNEAQARKRAAVAALVSTRAQHVATEAALQQARSERSRAEDAIGQIEGINARHSCR